LSASRFGSTLSGIANSTYITLVAFDAAVVGEGASVDVEPRASDSVPGAGYVGLPVRGGVPGTGALGSRRVTGILAREVSRGRCVAA
jgi:hypothetical protein